MKEEHSLRYYFTGILLSLLPLAIVFRLVILQTPYYKEIFEKSLEEVKEYQKNDFPVRGTIVDRNGNLLAGNQRAYEIGVALDQIRDVEEVSRVLSDALGEPASYYKETINSFIRLNEDPTTLPIDKVFWFTFENYAPQSAADVIEAAEESLNKSSEPLDWYKLNGLYHIKRLKRSYPNANLGANMIGFVGFHQDRREPVGYNGVEGFYNDVLGGKIVTREIPRHPTNVKDYNIIPDGASLVLTLDLTIQAMLEEELERALDYNGSKSGTIVVMDPRNGEVLGMAVTPTIDPNNYKNLTGVFDVGEPYNRAVSLPYEPGSIFKVLTVAAALDSGSVTPEFSYVDEGVLEYGGVTIYNWNRGSWGPQGLLGCLQHSLNVCMATLSTKYLGNQTFYAYMRSFGIGRPTGVDMAGEHPGILKTPHEGRWFEGDLAVNSFGQGLTTTPLQMVQAVAAIANNGDMMAVHIVKSIVQQGYKFDIEPRVVSKPIKPETAQYVSELMAQSIELEASDALVEGYRIAGKTGTAEIPDLELGGYHPYLTNASFVGFGPVDDPQFVVLVWFEEPRTSPWGSEVAAPVFADIVERLVVLMDIPPDDVRRGMANR